MLLAILFTFLLETLDIAFKNMAGRTLLAVPFLYLNVLAPIAVTGWLLWRDSGGPLPLRRPAAQPEG